jgi:4,5-dihydroxyphthalate decarboxylase
MMQPLTMPTRDYGLMKHMKKNISALNDVVRIEYPSFENILHAARMMVRDVKFDICEMPVTTYLCAKAHNKPFTAIPVFVTRKFHHDAIVYNPDSGIREPKDLEGRVVGVNRGYTVTTGVWARGVLRNEYNVDLDKIRWAATGDEHVAEFQLPENADYAFKGREMSDLFERSEIAAAVGAINAASSNVKPLIPNAVEAGFESYRKTGVYPVNHTIVVKNSLLEKYPGLAPDLFDAIKKSKDVYLSGLDGPGEGSGELSEEDALTFALGQGVGGDPFPLGVEPNHKALAALIQMSVDQKIIPRELTIAELFAKGTLELIG